MAAIQIHALSLIFIHTLICALAQKQNITIGSNLIPPQNSKWVSPNGQFAFGFYPLTPTLYVVGVWFDSISPKTLVWTVVKDQRDLPVERTSTLQLTSSGLSLYDDKKNLKRLVGGSDDVAAAAMLDSGNFVLLNVQSQPIWQSFDYPTDTLLPLQTLKTGTIIFSKASTTNYSTGRFELSMQADGNLVLYNVQRGDDAYWYPGPLGSGISLKFDPSGLLYFVNTSNMIVSQLSDGNAGPGQFFRRLTLESDGILAQYVWNMDGNDSSWSPVWKPVNDPCREVRGQCGPNGICGLTSQNQANCTCPPQFSFIDGDDHFKGCMPSTLQEQSCSTAGTRMSRLEHTVCWGGSHYSVLMNISESKCQQACISDCMCAVAIYGNTNCYKQAMPLIDLRQGADVSYISFVKVSDDFNPRPEQRKERDGKNMLALAAISISLLASSSLLAAVFSLWWFCAGKLHKASKITHQPKVVEGLKAFSYREIKAATMGFRKELGRGSFGKVYKGSLPDGRAVAVKTLVDRVAQEEYGEREFRTEMRVIGTCHHKNLVELYGFCDEGTQRILVYEYMCNRSLDTALFVGSGFLDWSVRVQIAMGIARGIRYLHEECMTQILHCDIKPQNILLDLNYNPKISDFGLAKLLRAEQTRTFTAARGTRGYIAPEWMNNTPVTVKVDVYSFGMMLLEIICCRKIVESDAPENQIILFDWIYECLEHGSLVKLVEQQQVEGVTIELRQLERMVLVGLWCIQEHPHLRPSINNVVQMMEGVVEITVPPRPVSPPPVLPTVGSFNVLNHV